MKKKDLQENPVVVDLELDVDQEKIAAFVAEHCGAALAEPQDAKIAKEGDGFVVTPQIIPISFALLISSTFAVSIKNFISIT